MSYKVNREYNTPCDVLHTNMYLVEKKTMVEVVINQRFG